MASGNQGRKCWRIELYGTGHGWLENPGISRIALDGVLASLESMIDDPSIGRIEIVRVPSKVGGAEIVRRMFEVHEPFVIDEESGSDFTV